MSEYSDKLKDPRWQKKRLEILSRDNWKCKKCGNSDDQLVVHHKKYFYDKDPWDYLDVYLVSLCKTCHDEEEFDKTILSDFPQYLIANGYLNCDIKELMDYISNTIDSATPSELNSCIAYGLSLLTEVKRKLYGV